MIFTDRDATDPLSFAWVSANAGSGKTRLLISRVTRLLLHGANVSRILCLTYTKAAAAEMAGRLFDLLGAWALLPDDKLQTELAAIGAGPDECKDLRVARRLFAQALETPGGLKIQTIHAFCQHLLARFPIEAGIPARFSVIDERGSIELLAQAREDVLEQAAHGDKALANAVALLAARANDIRFAEILDAAIAGRGKLNQLLARYGGDPEVFFHHLRKTLDVSEGETEQQMVSQFCAQLGPEKEQLLRVVQWLSSGLNSDQETADRISAFLQAGPPAQQYAELKKIFFTAEHKPRTKLVTNGQQSAQPSLMQYLQQLQDRFTTAEDRRRRCVTAALTESLLRTAFAVLARYEQYKRARAALDYDDLIDATIRLLQQSQSAQWVLYKLDGGIDHILVDEGQDTSPDQWRIVSALSAEFFAGQGTRPESQVRRLFVVGDEKQSIFSFQGAEPAAFGEYRNQFKHRAEDAYLPFVDFRPAISRRSARSVLSFVDAVFDNAAARDGLTTDAEPIHHDPDRKEIGRVEIWPFVPAPQKKEPDPLAPVDSPQLGAHTILATKIADRVAAILKDGACAPGANQPLAAGDIMILVRRRNHFAEEMIRQLQSRGVPVAGADRMVLTQQIGVLDLLALGNFVLLPEDDLNLACLLKSPIIGFQENDLYDLAQPRAGKLWAELCRRATERAIFGEAHEFLKQALSDADTRPPFEFYSRFLNLGARKRLVARLGIETEDAIDEFLALALIHQGSHPPSLQAFLTWCSATASDVKRDMEQGGGALRVMTVHGAKGLEAKLVILPDTVQIPDHERREALLYTDDCVYFGLPRHLECAPLTAAKAAARQREMREYRRLLYVAATRAKDVLIVCGYQSGNQRQPPADSWYSLLRPAGEKLGRTEQIAGEKMLVIGDPLPSGRAPGGAAPRLQLPSFLNAPAQREPISPLLRPSRIANAEEPPARSPMAHRQRLRQGSLVHALLAKLPEVAPARREGAARAYLHARGIPAAETETLIRNILGILADPQFAPLFTEESRAEVAFTATFPDLAGARISGQIDRLAVSATSVLIADFKTNRDVPASPAEVPALYRAQMALYREALRRMHPDKAVHCAFVWTDSAELMPVPDALLEQEFAALAEKAASISTA